MAKAAQIFEPESFSALIDIASSWVARVNDDEDWSTIYWEGNAFSWDQKHPGIQYLFCEAVMKPAHDLTSIF